MDWLSIQSWIQEHLEIGPSRTTKWIIAALFGAFVYYKYETWNFGIFNKLGIKGPKPWPLLGTMLPILRKGLLRHDLELKKLYGPVVGTFFGRQPILMIYDLDLVRAVTVKEFERFQNRNVPSIQDYPTRRILTVLKDRHWKHVRNILTPTFSAAKLRQMELQIEACAESFLGNLQQMANKNQVFDIRELSGAFTMDAIASTAFNMKINSHEDPNNQFVRMAKQIFRSGLRLRTLIFIFFPFLVKPLGKIGLHVFPRKVINFFVKAVDDAVEQRKSATESEMRVDFLQLMVNAEAEYVETAVNLHGDSSGGSDFQGLKGLAHEEVLAQSLLFFLAGYETTASTLSFLCYLLAVNDECQQKLITEIDDVMDGQQHITYDLLNKMEYLEMCINETLRIYPPGMRTDRVASEDIDVNGVFIPKGMVVGISIYALQNDPEYWPEPEKFIPERFSREEKAARNPYCFLPFGAGPRNCIGMRLALMEIKVAVVMILKKFRFVVCEETQIPLQLHKLRMRPKKGIQLRVEPRTATE